MSGLIFTIAVFGIGALYMRYCIMSDVANMNGNELLDFADKAKKRFNKREEQKRKGINIHERRYATKLETVDDKGNTKVVYGDWIYDKDNKKAYFKEW